MKLIKIPARLSREQWRALLILAGLYLAMQGVVILVLNLFLVWRS